MARVTSFDPDAVKTEVLEGAGSADEQTDYSCNSATLWRRDRNGRRALKKPSLLLPWLKRESDQRRICF